MKKIRSILILSLSLVIFLASNNLVYGQNAAIAEWVALYNGSWDDRLSAMTFDSEGNVYVTGSSLRYEPFTHWVCYTIKYDKNGNEIWANTYEEDNPHPSDIVVDSSGNVYMTGSKTIKLDADGVFQWAVGRGRMIEIDSLGNVYVAYSMSGPSSYDIVARKHARDGTLLWQKVYNGPANDMDMVHDMAVDASGNVYLAGFSRSEPQPGEKRVDWITIKYDTWGNLIWERRYIGPYHNQAHGITVDSSGNVYVTGESQVSTNGIYPSDFLTIKYDKFGNALWTATYNGPANYVDEGKEIYVDSSGDVYVLGESHGIGNPEYNKTGWSWMDYTVVKYDANGNQLWVARYNPYYIDHWDYTKAMAVDSSGNVYVTGMTAGLIDVNDFATVKFSSEGILLWVEKYNGPTNGHDTAIGIGIDLSGNVYVAGTIGQGIEADFAVLKYSQQPLEQKFEEIKETILNLPNDVFARSDERKKNNLSSSLDEARHKYERGDVQGAINILEKNILKRMDGYFQNKSNDDWIINEAAQVEVNTKVLSLIETLIAL